MGMTEADLSKKLIRFWKTAEWASFMDLLSEDVELKILGIDPIPSRENVSMVVKSGHE